MTRVVSVRVPDPGPLAALPGTALWLRGGDGSGADGDGMVAFGEAARLEATGPGRFDTAREWWRAWTAAADVHDEVAIPGTGPLAFGSFTFDDGPGMSALIVPRLIVGRREGVSWLTTVGDVPAEIPRAAPPAPLPAVEWGSEHEARIRWMGAVACAVHEIREGGLDKVVLARALDGLLDAEFDPRSAVASLSARYPGCWTYAIDGLVGATPELLASRTGDQVESLVLAGTTWPGGGSLDDGKSAVEHALAAESAIEVLAEWCDRLDVPDPHLLGLANVTHLATRITGTLRGGADALEVAARLHPTAAVCGTPAKTARDLLRELEDFDRGRYAGPVGWQDANGDGEWCVALRCARVRGRDIRLYAGCGIVGASDPAAEWRETLAKLAAVRGLFGSKGI